LRHFAATAVLKAIALIILLVCTFFPRREELHAPRKQLIQNGHKTSASWTRILFEKDAISAGLVPFKIDADLSWQ
jgi:hypothetical protein